jgi:hypothetical protein
MTHIFQEILKTMKPTFTNRNTSRTIIMVGRIFRVDASLLHVRPAGVFGRVDWPRVAVNLFTFANNLAHQAATRLRTSQREMRNSDFGSFATVAFANPLVFRACFDGDTFES